MLGEAIANSLRSIGLVVEIPLLGGLAELLGIFFGAVISGIIGALALDLIDRMIAKQLKDENAIKIFDRKSAILATQSAVVQTATANSLVVKNAAAKSIINRHNEAGKEAKNIVDEIDRTTADVDNINDVIKKLLSKK